MAPVTYIKAGRRSSAPAAAFSAKGKAKDKVKKKETLCLKV
jgi:aminoglycoside N3'-acetyltransferase